MTLDEIRKMYPQYNDLSDTELNDSLNRKYYAGSPPENMNLPLPEDEALIPKAGPIEGALDLYGGYNLARAGKVGINSLLENLAYRKWIKEGGGLKTALPGISNTIIKGIYHNPDIPREIVTRQEILKNLARFKK